MNRVETLETSPPAESASPSWQGPECPKCGHPRATNGPGDASDPGALTSACRRCGLVFALWPASQAAQATRLDDRGEALWAEVTASWASEEQHDVFLKHCSLEGLLAPAGRRYRQRLDRDPKDPMAARMQERILTMATATFVRMPVPRSPLTRTAWFWLLLVVCGLVGITAAMWLGRL